MAYGVVMELVLTAGLFSVILGTASRSQNLGPLSALGVGAYIILAGLWSSPTAGATRMSAARARHKARSVRSGWDQTKTLPEHPPDSRP